MTTDPRDAAINKYQGLHQPGAYLHQDWPLEFSTWEDAVEHFVRGNRSDAVTARSEIDEITALNLKEKELEKLAGDLGLDYYPLPEQTYTE